MRLLELLDMSGLGVKVKEWDEGFEDLRSIPHSFAFTFNDGGEPWSFYTDSEEEKVNYSVQYGLYRLYSCDRTLLSALFRNARIFFSSFPYVCFPLLELAITARLRRNTGFILLLLL